MDASLNAYHRTNSSEEIPAMAGNKNRRKRRRDERPTMHPNNKYSEKPPDFAMLASFYPSFEPFVFYSQTGRLSIDWTDFNATRELTRVLLLHDYGVNWWIPDGQLCPTVPNRSNYIHWIEDLLSSDVIPKNDSAGNSVRGFDIGTGANCIYPLLGASLFRWNFVGSDVTDVAIEWAEKNVKDNPHISESIEIRRVDLERNLHTDTKSGYNGPPILLGVVRDDEKFDFCMCNPPFFETMEEAGLNPKTSCGGTPEEMACPGGEKAFITRIIEDSVTLKQNFRWYTSMIGIKSNLKLLTSKLWEVGVSIVKTTEFVQGQTCRWGLAWSFVPPIRKTVSVRVAEKSKLSFLLEGVQHQHGAINVLKSIESFFLNSGASCTLNTSSFTVDVDASHEHCDVILNSECEGRNNTSISSSCLDEPTDNLGFQISVFQQTPGTLLVKSSLKQRYAQASGMCSSILNRLEENLKNKFCRGSTRA